MLYSEIKTPSNVRMFYESQNANNRHFFERATMKFFGDTMRSFGVRRINGNVFLYRKKTAIVNCFGERRRAGSDDNFLGVWKLDPDTYDLDRIKDELTIAKVYRVV